MRIQHNIPALSAYRNYSHNVSAVNKNLEKLSSGYKINRAGDDAAGLAISEKMRIQITGLEQAQNNAKSGINLVQTAEGAMTEIHDMLNRMYTLAEQSANGTYSNDVDREQLQKEVVSLRTEIDRIAEATNYNGINLLDGSLDENSTAAVSDESAISNIVSESFTSAGASPAVESTYKTNRPAAATKQKNAEFTVSLDDLSWSGVKQNDIFKLTIGDTTLSYKADADGKTMKDVAAGLLQSGLKVAAGKTLNTDFKVQGDDAVAEPLAATDKWDAALETATAAAAANKYVKIDGHYWEMSADGDMGIKFTQVDTIGDSKNVNPDYTVTAEIESAANANLKLSGTTNWQVQDTKTGIAIGSSHQAQVETTIDFSKLKDGDRLVVGDKSYVLKIGAASTTAVDTTNHPGDQLVDLHEIFATDSDLLDADKQAQALDLIVEKMGASGSTTWSAGNGGVRDGKGTITFQSLSSYVDDAAKIESKSGSTAIDCNMTTEDKVMKQFYSERADVPASTSFDLDVTKLKAGDTVTIGGTTFEFTDGDYVTDKSHEKVDLSSFGIEGGIQSSKTADVMNALKTAVDAALGTSKYTTSVDGATFKITAKEDATTTVKEARITPEVKLSEDAYAGSALTLQIGDTPDEFNKMAVSVKDMHASAMKFTEDDLGEKPTDLQKKIAAKGLSIADIDISTQEGASEAMAVIKNATNYVSDVRGDLGALQNRLDHTINNLSVTQENITDAESNIRDVDIAKEMMAYTKNNILVQSAQAMLAQANQLPQGVLQLLG